MFCPPCYNFQHNCNSEVFSWLCALWGDFWLALGMNISWFHMFKRDHSWAAKLAESPGYMGPSDSLKLIWPCHQALPPVEAATSINLALEWNNAGFIKIDAIRSEPSLFLHRLECSYLSWQGRYFYSIFCCCHTHDFSAQQIVCTRMINSFS